jgi:hypothetical protein
VKKELGAIAAENGITGDQVIPKKVLKARYLKE